MTIVEQVDNGTEYDNFDFRFSENWTAFLRHLDEGRIVEAEKSIQC